MKLFDLAGADPDLRFSPHCWKTKMALAHKGVEVETIPWRFTEKDRIAETGQGAVPVLDTGARLISDSWAVAEWLEEAYPAEPSLFPDGGAREFAKFVNHWGDTAITPIVARLICPQIHAILDEKDKGYFRESREQRFGMALEALCPDRPAMLASLNMAFAAARRMLADQPFLCGDAPAYADYALFGQVMWARTSADLDLTGGQEPLAGWANRLLDLHDGLARRAKTAAAAGAV